MSNKVNLYQGDCMDAMAKMPDNAYDLAIVDPPYGIGFDGNTTVKGKAGRASTFSNKQHHIKKGWDNKRPPIEYFKELQRVSKNQIIWGGNYFADLLPAHKGWIYWDKKIMSAKNKNYSDGELAWSSFDCILRKVTYDWIGFGYLNNKEGQKKIHPTEKPVKLYEWLLQNYAKPNDKILDTHGGSMSIALSCHNLGFDLDLWELDSDYYKAGTKRYNNHIKQLQIF